jgi:hypothetical protein
MLLTKAIIGVLGLAIFGWALKQVFTTSKLDAKANELDEVKTDSKVLDFDEAIIAQAKSNNKRREKLFPKDGDIA